MLQRGNAATLPKRHSAKTDVMKKRIFPAALFALAALCLCVARGQTESPGAAAPVEVYFSPRGGCTEAVVESLQAANETVLVQAYSFTSVPIAKALVDAHKRGVKVQVILDKSQRTEKYSSATFLNNAGIPTFIDAAHAIAHNKVMVIDGTMIITGSFNFTKAAEENNAENLLVIRDAPLAEKYAANWEAHLRHSERYEGQPGAELEKKADDRQQDRATGYVASKNSQAFHRLSCTAAAKIADRNLIHYASRDDAIRAGKRPCALCKP